MLLAALLGLPGLARPKPAAAAVAVNPITKGKWTPKAIEYKFPASVDTEVVPEGGTATELWARVWYPTGAALPSTGAPIVVMLHGNHATCGHKDSTGKWYVDNNVDYSTKGTCPSTSPRISPSHLGYDYIGVQLATQGYVVISINSNRGINGLPGVANDPNLVYRRARLILRHLQALSDWNKGTGPKPVPPFVAAVKGKLDFSHVSLFGHSRGGDAIVAAYYFFQADVDTWRTKRLPPKTAIVALAAVAPTADTSGVNVSGQAPLAGVAFGVLLPMCDGDVDRLNGIHFYDRGVNLLPGGVGQFRASFAAWGADHNAFNTMWQPNDAYNILKDQPGTQKCPGQTAIFPTIGNSDKQKAVALYFTEAVIQARSKSATYGQLLNPEFSLPGDLPKMTDFDRGYFPGLAADSALRLIKFEVPNTGDCAKKLFTYPGAISSCGVPPEHDYDPKNLTASSNTWIARIRWGAPATTEPPLNGYYYAGMILNGGAPVDLSRLKTLEFRMGPDCTLQTPAKAGYACTNRSAQDNGKNGSQNVMFILRDSAGTYSSYVPALAHTDDRPAVGLDETPAQPDESANPLFHAIMSSVRIPISQFLLHAPSNFDTKHVAQIYLLLSPDGKTGPNPRGGIFLGDIWADSTDVAVMTAGDRLASAGPPLPPNAPRIAATSETPAAAQPLTLPVAEQATQADVGNDIVDAARKTAPVPAPPPGLAAPAPATATRQVVDLTFKSREQMIDDDAGFSVIIGGQAIKADFIARGPGANVVKLAIPAQAFDIVSDGAPVAVASGGSRWNFGALKKGAAH